jgi:hypothetical protein
MTKPIETMAEPWDDFEGVAPLALAPPAATPIVPNTSIAGRSLAAVVAIMTFLAALTTGERLAIGCRPRGHHPGASCSGARC